MNPIMLLKSSHATASSGWLSGEVPPVFRCYHLLTIKFEFNVKLGLMVLGIQDELKMEYVFY